MTPCRITTSLLALLLVSTTDTANSPPLAGIRRGSETPQDDLVVSLGAPGPGREASPQGVLQQVAQGVFPGSLWAAVSGWHPAHHVSSDITDKYTYQQDRGRARLNTVFNYYMPDTTNVSWHCMTDVKSFYIELARRTGWAVKMVDSWGKFPDGQLAGNTWATGLLDECIAIHVDQELPQAHFKGQYCALTYKKAVEEEEDEEEDETEEDGDEAPRKAGVRMAGVAARLGLVIPDNLYATCIPSTCTREEYRESLERHLELEGGGVELQDVYCQTENMPAMEYSGGDVTMIVLFSVLGCLVLAGTGGDVWTVCNGKRHEKTGYLRYVLPFSLYTNLNKMFYINVKENKEVISCLHGIRVLTMGWVVLGHAYLMSINASANKLPFRQAIIDNPYPYQIIINGTVSVDTFFFMSGLLVAYNLTKEVGKTGKFNIPAYYIHRFVRLAPPIMLLCGFFAVFPPLFMRGSLSPALTEPGYMVDLCRRYWWRDSFFLTNWFFNEVDTESCVPVCWYTSVDFQLYIVAPLMFLPILYRRKPGAAWLGCLLVASAVIPAFIIGVNEMPPTQVMNVPYSQFYEYTKWVYTKPYCRASPYLVGMALGYFMREVDKEKVQLKWWQVALGWIAALATMSAVVFGIADYNDFSTANHEYNGAVSILYGGLHRLAWGAALAWLVFACHMGYGGPANSLLAHPFWQPLSRLTYTTFLIALNMQILLYGHTPQVPLYYSNTNKIMETAGTILLSGCGAVLLSLLVEAPVLGLEKLILRRESRGLQYEKKEDVETIDLQNISAD
ncbi:nose resistant to fluoxetine protein 6-like [Eriocheir sinensis]|uniref:nose resistant to fluoxetine protein 6-like n=1 Tax=Eriocheir sinensis TaxID=95602 RepID=UPI0021C69B63|nr:nose resistant to fluoxetine protein 6-like [Eriocheir sinensis]